MALPSNRSATLSKVLDDILGLNGIIKQLTAAALTKAGTDTTSAKDILDYAEQLRRAKAQLATLVAVPGIAAYAQEQLGASISADYNTMIAALDATVAWIAANFPKDANGFGLAFTLGAGASVVWRLFPASALGGYRTALTALAGTFA